MPRVFGKSLASDGSVGGDEPGELRLVGDVDDIIEGGEFEVGSDLDEQRLLRVDLTKSSKDLQ